MVIWERLKGQDSDFCISQGGSRTGSVGVQGREQCCRPQCGGHCTLRVSRVWWLRSPSRLVQLGEACGVKVKSWVCGGKTRECRRMKGAVSVVAGAEREEERENWDGG